MGWMENETGWDVTDRRRGSRQAGRMRKGKEEGGKARCQYVSFFPALPWLIHPEQEDG